jgi:RNA polymerase primary sigma factor
MAVVRLLRMDIDNVLHTLSPRECGVLRMRYGLDDGQEKTLEEVGARYKVCLQILAILSAACL